MSLFHAREYFCNALYALGIWKTFFGEKRGFILGNPEETKNEPKPASAKIGGNEQASNRVKLESLINLIYISLVLEDSYSALMFISQIESEKFVLDNDKQYFFLC